MIVRGALLLALLPLLVTACGGNGKKANTPSPAKRLTQKQFVSAANAVCVQSDRRVYNLGALSIDPTGWAKTLAVANSSLTAMSALRPPATEQAGFDRLLTFGRQLRDGVKNVHAALVKKDYTAASKAQYTATAADTKIHNQAKKLGLTFCEQLLTNWPA